MKIETKFQYKTKFTYIVTEITRNFDIDLRNTFVRNLKLDFVSVNTDYILARFISAGNVIASQSIFI